MRIRNGTGVRGLRDIRTHSGRVKSAGVPYMTYMRISALEMEKARRETEKFSAEARIRNIDLRLGAIQAEKEALLASDEKDSLAAARGSARGDSALAPRDDNKGFRIKY